MKNFIILFQEKEGTTALVRMLDKFDEFSIVHQQVGGWEPFNVHNCGEMKFDHYFECVNKVLNDKEVDIKAVNKLYCKTAKKPLSEINKEKAAGFKMRLYAPFKSNVLKVLFHPFFERRLIQTLKKNDTVVFLSVRQDIFRWALSKYHGDGTGKKGHLQFKMAADQINKKDIPKIHVHPLRFWFFIKICELRHWRKKMLYRKLTSEGIEVYPVTYEEFLSNKESLIKRMYKALQIPVSNKEIGNKIQEEINFRKVHSHDISGFVKNHKEINDKFCDRYISWANL